MDSKKTQNAFNEVSKCKYAADDALVALDNAKEKYLDVIKQECIDNILTIQEEEGKLTQRDLNVFLSSMLSSIKNVYQ